MIFSVIFVILWIYKLMKVIPFLKMLNRILFHELGDLKLSKNDQKKESKIA